MRISDWSSDVCSSDLEEVVLIEFLSENSTYMPLKINSYGTFFKERRANISMVSGVVVGALTLLLLNFLFFSIKIGRAHVCTPVTNSHIVCHLLLEKTNIIHL